LDTHDRCVDWRAERDPNKVDSCMIQAYIELAMRRVSHG